MGLVAEVRAGLDKLLHRDDRSRHRYFLSGSSLRETGTWRRSRRGTGMCVSRVDYRLSCKGYLPPHCPALAPLEQVRREIHREFAALDRPDLTRRTVLHRVFLASAHRTRKTPHGIFRLTKQNKKRT